MFIGCPAIVCGATSRKGAVGAFLVADCVISNPRHPTFGNPCLGVVGLDGLEPTTSVLSGLRSNRLSYRPPATAIIPAMQRNAIGVGASRAPIFRRWASRTIGAADPAWSDSILSLTAAAITSPTNTPAVENTKTPAAPPTAANRTPSNRPARKRPAAPAALPHRPLTRSKIRLAIAKILRRRHPLAILPRRHFRIGIRSMQSPDTGVPDAPGPGTRPN